MCLLSNRFGKLEPNHHHRHQNSTNVLVLRCFGCLQVWATLRRQGAADWGVRSRGMCLLAGIAKWVENRIKDISFIHQPPKNLRLNLGTGGVSGRILYHGKVLIHANQKIRIHFHFYTDRILFSTTHTNCSNKSGGPFFLRLEIYIQWIKVG